MKTDTRVTHCGRPLWGVGVVRRVAAFVGLDGRHWVLVEFPGGWLVHCESKDLEPAD